MLYRNLVTRTHILRAILASFLWMASAHAQPAPQPPIIRATDALGGNPFPHLRSGRRTVAAKLSGGAATCAPPFVGAGRPVVRSPSCPVPSFDGSPTPVRP